MARTQLYYFLYSFVNADNISRNFGCNDEEDFHVTAGVLRLSTKYIIESLRIKAIAHLQTAWPLTLRGWDSREDLGRLNKIYPSSIVCSYLSYWTFFTKQLSRT